MSRALVPRHVVLAFTFTLTALAACGGDELGPRASSAEVTVGRAETLAAIERSEPVPAATHEVSAGTSDRVDCPEGMLLVEGEYCPDVEQVCEKWLDPPGTKYAQFRCATYRKPAVCKGERRHVRYCIDRTERREDESELPKSFVSFDSAKKLCAASGARVCTESEWQFACEGEEMRPYPYGFERDSTACNVDHTEKLMTRGRLADHRRPVAENPRCKSPFGVMDMSGNLEEWVAADGSKFGWKQVLKGSYWIPSRHACRQFQVGHGPEYGGTETGTRCCKDSPPNR